MTGYIYVTSSKFVDYYWSRGADRERPSIGEFVAIGDTSFASTAGSYKVKSVIHIRPSPDFVPTPETVLSDLSELMRCPAPTQRNILPDEGTRPLRSLRKPRKASRLDLYGPPTEFVVFVLEPM